MSINTFLSIASFSISLGGLVAVFIIGHRKRQIVLTVAVAALVATSSVGLYRVYQHNQMIAAVQESIVAKLVDNTWTFDQLYNELHFISFPIVNEALFATVDSGTVGHRLLEVRGSDGTLLDMRVYYVR